jgi:hypothetical protein
VAVQLKSVTEMQRMKLTAFAAIAVPTLEDVANAAEYLASRFFANGQHLLLGRGCPA